MSGIMGVMAVGQALPPPDVTLNTYSISSPNGIPGGATASVTSGIAPYTYAWTKVSGNTVTVGSPSSASTTFNGSNASAVYRCTVTDSAGHQDYADISILFFDTGF